MFENIDCARWESIIYLLQFFIKIITRVQFQTTTNTHKILETNGFFLLPILFGSNRALLVFIFLFPFLLPLSVRLSLPILLHTLRLMWRYINIMIAISTGVCFKDSFDNIFKCYVFISVVFFLSVLLQMHLAHFRLQCIWYTSRCLLTLPCFWCAVRFCVLFQAFSYFSKCNEFISSSIFFVFCYGYILFWIFIQLVVVVAPFFVTLLCISITLSLSNSSLFYFHSFIWGFFEVFVFLHNFSYSHWRYVDWCKAKTSKTDSKIHSQHTKWTKNKCWRKRHTTRNWLKWCCWGRSIALSFCLKVVLSLHFI